MDGIDESFKGLLWQINNDPLCPMDTSNLYDIIKPTLKTKGKRMPIYTITTADSFDGRWSYKPDREDSMFWSVK